MLIINDVHLILLNEILCMQILNNLFYFKNNWRVGEEMKKKRVYLFFKRLLDILCSFLAIVVFAIPMLIVAIAIKCDSKGPILFKQERVGKNKRIFKIWKFRSMYIDTDPNAPTRDLHNPDKHITKVGKFIRKTSIDELPQLFNILFGKMSVIGPRPVLMVEHELIQERDKYGANDIRPGLTGLAQISGRDILDAKTKAKLDGDYVAKMSLWMDIKLIFKTIGVVFKQEGVVEGDKVKENKLDSQREKVTTQPEVLANEEKESEEKELIHN